MSTLERLMLMLLSLVLLCASSGVSAATTSKAIIGPKTVETASGDSSDFTGYVLPDEVETTLDTPVSDPVRTYIVDATAYTSSVEECDNDPFITADGSHTRDGIIATNFLPFGTKVRIPSLFGNKVFEVHDRMNQKYWMRIDVWMEKKADMWQFGINHNVKIEVLEMGDNSTQWNKRNK